MNWPTQIIQLHLEHISNGLNATRLVANNLEHLTQQKEAGDGEPISGYQLGLAIAALEAATHSAQSSLEWLEEQTREAL